MTLFNIALKNVRKSFKNYLLYFVSMIFSISMYYVFKVIQYTGDIQKATGGSRMLQQSFKVSSVVILIFSCIFIWYSNSFFTRKRKKEIGLYSMMGVKKKQIGRMMFYETIVMGILATLVSILLGTILSKYLTELLFKLMGSSFVCQFKIIPKAVIETAKAFSVIFIVSSLHGYSIIYRYNLIDLFKSESKREKEPKASFILALLAVLFIGAGYFMAFKEQFALALVILVVTVAGTYLLFGSLIVFIVKTSKKNKKKFYRGMNMIGTCDLLYRAKSNSRTLATIAVLSASTLTALGVTSVMNYENTKTLSLQHPFHIQYMNKEGIEGKVEEILKKDTNNEIKEKVAFNMLKLRGNIYGGDGNTYFVKEEEAKRIFKILNVEETFNIKDGEFAYLMGGAQGKSTIEAYLNSDVNIKGKAQENFKLKLKEIKTNTIVSSYAMGNAYVITEKDYEKFAKAGEEVKVNSYILNDGKNMSEEMINEISKAISGDIMDKSYDKGLDIYAYQYKIMKEFSGLMLFVGAFLGLIFLICTGSIIFFKQISEANEEKGRYQIIRKIGVNNREINKSIRKQQLMIFGLPLLIGITHSLAAISMLKSLITTSIVIPFLMIIIPYTIVYALYYVLTVRSYTKILNEA